MSTIEQTLTALASIDEAGFVELTFDASIYSVAAVTAAATAVSDYCTLSVIDPQARRIRLTAVDPKTARQAIGNGLAVLAKLAIRPLGES